MKLSGPQFSHLEVRRLGDKHSKCKPLSTIPGERPNSMESPRDKSQSHLNLMALRSGREGGTCILRRGLGLSEEPRSLDSEALSHKSVAKCVGDNCRSWRAGPERSSEEQAVGRCG